MPDLFYLIRRWWKKMLGFILLALAVAYLACLLQPKKYCSVATAIPVSPYLSDKAAVFNDQVNQLYPSLGTADELDMIIGTGQLDTIYLAVARQFNLAIHYHVKEDGPAALSKAAYLLRKNSKVMKSEYGELKLKVWDKDPAQAAVFANALLAQLSAIHSNLKNAINRQMLENIQRELALQKGRPDNASPEGDAATQRLQKLLDQYRLMTDSPSPALLVVEPARASAWPDTPRVVTVLLVTGFGSLLFIILLALAAEAGKEQQRGHSDN